jgi:hypothetical protein
MRVPTVVSLLALVIATAALVVALTREPEDLASRLVVVSNASAKDAIDAKEIRADCPAGTTLLGGGFAVQHGHDTPSVAVYQSFPVTGGWEAQAHETDPEDDRRFPWTLQSIAYCVRG